jgi:hypothetical protein
MSTLGSQSHFLNAVKVALSEAMTAIENPTGAIRQIMSQRMEARHGPPRVGTMIWTSRAALGAGGRNSPIG